MDSGFSVENFADDQGNRNPKRFIPTEKAKEILDDCAMLGVGAIEFTGGGEPTVHPDCVDIIGHAQALGMETGLVTNGVRLRDHEVYRNLDWLRISLDAGTAETYERIRESRMWPKVMANLKLAGTFERPYVGVGFVVTRENYQELPQACRIVRAANIPYVRISAMFSTDGANYYNDIIGEISDLRGQAAAFAGEKFKIVDFFSERVDDLDQGRPDYKFCGEQQFVLYIGGDQKIYTCCTNAYTTHGEIGDLKEQRFSEWLAKTRRFDFDARGCHHCQYHGVNRAVNYMLDKAPAHVDFVDKSRLALLDRQARPICPAIYWRATTQGWIWNSSSWTTATRPHIARRQCHSLFASCDCR
jgi:MoaA/NifB/PqqE/SkfB family radical SAM enzyme